MRSVPRAQPRSSLLTESLPQFPRTYTQLPRESRRVAIIAASGEALIASCHSIILDMVNRRHRVFACAPAISDGAFRVLSHLGAEVCSLPGRRLVLDKYHRLRALSAMLRDADPHVVLLESLQGAGVAAAAAKIAGARHLATIVPSLGRAFMEGGDGGLPGGRFALKTVYRAIFNASDTVVFHSVSDRAFAEESGFLAKDKGQLCVGGWGEDLQRHVARPLPPLDRGILFLMATPLDRRQGVAEFCEAAKAIRRKTQRARFFFASTPGEAADPLPTAFLKNYRDSVQYIGPVDDASRLIARCHAVVAPSYGDGAPRSLVQAMALGRPVVATDTRSCRDFVLDGSNGFFAAVRDTASLARAMIQILQRPHLMPKMADASRRLALRHYDRNAVNARLLEALGL